MPRLGTSAGECGLISNSNVWLYLFNTIDVFVDVFGCLQACSDLFSAACVRLEELHH